jgi:hypothetical protein
MQKSELITNYRSSIPELQHVHLQPPTPSPHQARQDQQHDMTLKLADANQLARQQLVYLQHMKLALDKYYSALENYQDAV